MMNRAAEIKRKIVNNLTGLIDRDLVGIANFVEFTRHQKSLKPGKMLKLRGILKGRPVEARDLDRHQPS